MFAPWKMVQKLKAPSNFKGSATKTSTSPITNIAFVLAFSV
jgi:hypothetical protein